MNTAAKPILLQQGQELSLGMRVVDPEGTSIRPEEGFTVFINGVIDDHEKCPGYWFRALLQSSMVATRHRLLQP